MDRIYDFSKLSKRMEKYRYSQNQLADSIGISRTSLNQKLNNKVGFTQREIHQIIQVLEIPRTMVYAYFFSEAVRKSEFQNNQGGNHNDSHDERSAQTDCS